MNTQNHFSLIAAGADLLDEANAGEIQTVAKGTRCTWRSTGRYAFPFVKILRNVPHRRTDLLARSAPAPDRRQFSCPASWRLQIPAGFDPYGHKLNHGTMPQFKLDKDWA